MAYVRSNLDEIVAGLPGVTRAVRRQAVALEGRIKANVPVDTGRLFRSVKVEKAAAGKDYWVHVEAEYASFVDLGFFNVWANRRLEGRNFIKKAVY